MVKQEQFALSLLSTLTFMSLWIGQASTAKAEGRPLAERMVTEQTVPQQTVSQQTVPNCHPANATALAKKPNGCAPVTSRSLTVVGLGLVTAPADIALLEFRFSSQEALNASDKAPGLSIQTARKNTEAALQPVVTALTNTGIPSRNITLQTNSLQSPALLVRVDKPTQEGLQKTVLTVDQALKSTQNQPLFLQSIGVGYAVNSCQVLQRSARRLALRDAQEQLTSLAQEVGVQAGELLSVTVLPLQGAPNSTGCGSKVGVPNTPIPIVIDDATPPYNPSDQPEVQVRSQVSVTRAIKP